MLALVRGEAVIHPDPVRAGEILLAASDRAMRGVPRAVAAAVAIRHADLHAGACVLAQIVRRAVRFARPVVAGVVAIGRERTSVRRRAGQRLMAVRYVLLEHIGVFAAPRIDAVVEARDDVALLGEI